MGGDCFAAKIHTANSSRKESNISLYQVKIKPALKEIGVNIQKAAERKDVRAILGTTVIPLGVSALMYRYLPSHFNYPKIWNSVKEYFGYKPAPTKWK